MPQVHSSNPDVSNCNLTFVSKLWKRNKDMFILKTFFLPKWRWSVLLISTVRFVSIERFSSIVKWPILSCRDWDLIWRSFAHFGKILKIFGKFWGFYLVFGKILNLLILVNFVCYWAIEFGVNGQILNKNPAIWSHWLSATKGHPQTWPCECLSGVTFEQELWCDKQIFRVAKLRCYT